MPSLNRVVDTLTQMSDPTPEFDAGVCLNERHHHAGRCTVCADVCPLSAITMQVGPQIDPAICQSCGVCVAACPTGALRGRRSEIDLWREARRAAQNGSAALVCKAVGAGQFAATRIPCFGALAPEFYIALAAVGLYEAQLYTADCAQCPLQGCLEQGQHAVEAARHVLDQMGRAIDIVLRRDAPPPAETARSGMSRRGFLRTFLKPSEDAAAAEDALDELGAAGISWRRALLLDALLRTAIPPDAELPTEPGSWGTLRVNETCIGCKMCAQFCPTGALAATDDAQETVTIWFSAARCTACGLCVRACFRRSIEPVERVALRALAEGGFVALRQAQPPLNSLRAGAKARQRA